MRMKNVGDNIATTRVSADNAATFGRDMMFGKTKADMSGVQRVMSPGTLRAATVDAKEGEFDHSNPQFNPKSKQIFAALNYGRRPHGSTTSYGMSYMVLNPKFKTNAIYFAGDTFFQKQTNTSAKDQVSFDLLGAIYAKAKIKMREDLYASCILDGRLTVAMPSQETTLLLEAHLFEPLLFSGNLVTIYLSNRDKPSSKPIVGSEWQNIHENARIFAQKHGAKLIAIN